MLNLLLHLEIISLLFYTASLLTPVVNDLDGFGSGILMLFGGLIFGILPAYANIFYFYCLFTTYKGNKRISISFVIFFALSSFFYISILCGIGFYYWLIAIFMMAYASYLPEEKELERKKIYWLYFFSLLLFSSILSWAIILYLVDEKHPFGTLYFPF